MLSASAGYPSLASVMKEFAPLLLLLAMIAACSGNDADGVQDEVSDSIADGGASSMAELADEYLFLELSMGWHDESHVDAYFGAEAIRERANEAQLSLEQIRSAAAALLVKLNQASSAATDVEETARIEGMIARLGALHTRIALQDGQMQTFDEESRRLFGAAAPDYDEAHFQAIIDDINLLVGGEGDLSVRVNDFQQQFVVPPDRLPEVFAAAIAECRRRTLLYVDLPDDESFSIEYVTDKPWSGYNWYQGNSQSLIQINTDLPIFISRAVDLGCHEGYPGHHTFNALLEKNLVEDRNWAEFSLYPLFSPQSLIAEGSGNYGIDLAFPGAERTDFEKAVLFPLAGLDAAEADRYYELQALLGQLNYAGNEAARDYLNGDIDRDEAVRWLIRYALSSPERALQRTEFFDVYRSYVINYNLGKDMVRDYVERDTNSVEERWKKFEHLLSSAMTPADLQ
ncbi:MAG: hypothetical protein ACI88G_000191 [Woeseiaceae bacterium]|jgi:hypothetical protein